MEDGVSDIDLISDFDLEDDSVETPNNLFFDTYDNNIDTQPFPLHPFDEELCQQLLEDEDILSLPDLHHHHSSGSSSPYTGTSRSTSTIIAKKPKRKRKRLLANAFPRILKRDVRRFMAQMFLNMYNANDNSFTSGLLTTLCIPSCGARYFMRNRTVTDVRGVENIVALGSSLTSVHPVDIVFALQGCVIKQYKDSKESFVEFDVIVKGTNLVGNLLQVVKDEPPFHATPQTMQHILSHLHAHEPSASPHSSKLHSMLSGIEMALSLHVVLALTEERRVSRYDVTIDFRPSP